MEIWKDMFWYEWQYQVTKTGLFKSLNYQWYWVEKILTGYLSNWYLDFCFYKNNIRKTFWIHRAIALTFIDNPENKPQVNHKNWIKTDNRIENLEWCTASENCLHRFRILWHKSSNYWKFWKLHHNSKQVRQFTPIWILITIWDSVMDIERELWIDNSSISKCCNWKRKTAWGFKWEFN